MESTWSRRLFTLGAVVLFGAASLAFAQNVSYTATLTGANEVPANSSTNTGVTFVTVNAATGVVTWNTATTIAPAAVSGHHIHRGAAGTNGPVVVNFSGLYTGTVNAGTTLATEIVGNPTNFYVNLHTSPNFAGGEIRAQLVALPVVGSVPVLGLPLLGLLALALAGFGAFVFWRAKRV